MVNVTTLSLEARTHKKKSKKNLGEKLKGIKKDSLLINDRLE